MTVDGLRQFNPVALVKPEAEVRLQVGQGQDFLGITGSSTDHFLLEWLLGCIQGVSRSLK